MIYVGEVVLLPNINANACYCLYIDSIRKWKKNKRKKEFLTSGVGLVVHLDDILSRRIADFTIRVKTVRQMKFLPTVGVPWRIETCWTQPDSIYPNYLSNRIISFLFFRAEIH